MLFISPTSRSSLNAGIIIQSRVGSQTNRAFGRSQLSIWVLHIVDVAESGMRHWLSLLIRHAFVGSHIDMVLHEPSIFLLEFAGKTRVVRCIMVGVHAAVLIVLSRGVAHIDWVILHQKVVSARIVSNSLIALA